VPNILNRGFDKGYTVRLPAFVFHLFESAKFEPRLPLRFLACHPAPLELTMLMLQTVASRPA